jgi:MoaA/NifB/PqqE/SkfB family radical SAM enzyme
MKLKIFTVCDGKPDSRRLEGIYLKKIINSLNKLVILQYNGNDVTFNAFIVKENGNYQRNPRKRKNGLHSAWTYRANEPILAFVGRQLTSVLRRIVLYHDDRPIKVDGFRLRSNKAWAKPAWRNPAEILLCLPGKCETNCDFCYQKGISPEMMRYPSRKSDDELDLRINWLRRGYNLPAPTVYKDDEHLSHPRVLEILKEVRKAGNHLIILQTNGRKLNPKMVEELSKLAPIQICLSLISSNKATRQKLMKDRKPEIAINAPILLKEKKIPYIAIFVAWPSIPIDDIESSLRYVDAYDAQSASIYYPGFTRFSPKEMRPSWKSHLHDVIDMAARLRCELTVPIVFDIHRYELRYLQKELWNIAPAAVIKNSPSWKAGLRAGDLIIAINEKKMHSLPMTRKVLTRLATKREPTVCVTYKRETEVFKAEWSSSEGRDYTYPYTSSSPPFGIDLPQGFDTDDLKNIVKAITIHRANNALLLSSELMANEVKTLIIRRGSPILRNRVRIEVPQNRYFGGNVIIGDLLTVHDYIQHLKERRQAGAQEPDLVMVPSSPFSEWGIDLVGRSYQEICRETGYPTVLLPCKRFAR